MSRNPVLIRTLGAVGIAALLTTAACGSDESGTADAVPTAAASVTAAAAAATAPAQLAGLCRERAAPDPRQGQGAAGSTELPLVFTNVGGRTCALDGFPVSPTCRAAPTALRLGAAATRSGESAGAVTLAPDATATAMVRAVEVQNYPADTCAPTPVAGLRVYPPNDTGSIFVPYATTGCSKTGDGLNQLSVQAVTG
ncbi:DUF4232 domain-containing protein [Rhodococcus hoagii]|nr:DUF4232 domain-containing protein [Prescottella equi]